MEAGKEGRGFSVIGMLWPAVLAGLLLVIPACEGKPFPSFDNPSAEVELERIKKTSFTDADNVEGTLFYGEARSVGTLTAENVYIFLRVRTKEGDPVGEFSSPVSRGVNAEGEFLNNLAVDVAGSFKVYVPGYSPGQVAPPEVTFVFTSPDQG